MADWTHPICDACYSLKEGFDRVPVRVIDTEPEWCCFCGDETEDGIYYRSDPATTPCHGIHPSLPALPAARCAMGDSFVLAADDVKKPPYYTLTFYGERKNSAVVDVRLEYKDVWHVIGFQMPRRWAEERKGKRYYLVPIDGGYEMREVPDV